ncbi:MAG: hypothetical protein PHQ42_02530 [Patescibacteria group bacterium]|nr:hypothetical protein [Patescibacteria group bacterium]
MKLFKIDYKNCGLCAQSLLYSIGVLAYVTIVALVMRNGEKLFGKEDTFWGPIAFLMLFVFSALITASLVLGRPIYLYLNGKKEKAVRLFFCNIVWLFIITLIIFISQIIWQNKL